MTPNHEETLLRQNMILQQELLTANAARAHMQAELSRAASHASHVAELLRQCQVSLTQCRERLAKLGAKP